MKKSRVIHGDCIEVMQSMEDNSIDALVSDPPYGISFMGKKWDEFTPKSFQEFSYQWGTEALRVLKPGGYCLAFSGTRTYHRMVCGLEDAGFTIKDMIMWCYGSGFPKSLDISKAIDKHLGKERKVIGKREKLESWNYKGNRVFQTNGNKEKVEIDITQPNSKQAQQWDGWGTGLKPALEPVVVAQKPYIGTYAENVLKYGVGGLNIGKCRIQYQANGEDPRLNDESKNFSRGKHTNGTVNIAPDGNEMRMFKKEKGRFPSNLLLTHHPECILIGSKEVGSGKFILHKEQNRKPLSPTNATFTPTNSGFRPDKANGIGNYGVETVNAYSCHPDCPIRILDEQTQGNIHGAGYAKTEFRTRNYEASNYNLSGTILDNRYGDKGGASRFFYCGKAHKSERNAGLMDLKDNIIKGFNASPRDYDGKVHCETITKNNIATLKPINVMRYLVRLITPPNGTVLDPFAGSGTTGIACIIEGFNYILIEKRERFAKIIIPKRLKYWKDPNHWEILKDKNSLEKVNTLKNKKQNVSMENFL